MTKPTTRLVDWNRSAVDAAVGLLTAAWDRDGPVDWSDLLVLTQTKGAARRLRYALARHVDEAGHGMFPPRFSTPSLLFAPPAERAVASEVACLLLWEELVKETNLEEFDSLFPKPPEGKADAWARTVAKSLHGLRRTLSEADRDCGKVASDESLALQEPDRWSDLAKLEELYRERLGATGRADPFDAKREAAGSPVLPAGIGRVMALGVSGFPGLAEIALKGLVERGTPVEMVAFGPPEASFADLFDDWGRPLRESWAKRSVPLTDDQLFLFPDERAQAQAIVEALGAYGGSDGRVALGVVDADLKPYLKQFADEAGNSLSFSDPEGLAPTGTAFYALLSALAGLVADPSYRQASAFLRFPEARAWLESEEIGVGELDLFAQLDQLLVKRMPVSLADAVSLAVPDLRKPLQRLVQLVADLRNKPFASTLRSFLIGATGGREFDPAEAADLSYLSLSPTLAEALNDLEEAGSVSLDSAFPLLLDSMRKKRVRQEMVAGAHPMLGWLELPWEMAPRLLLAGFNEGCVPDPVPGDAFLPENLRRELGLWTSEDRFSRDAYLLQWLLASRSEVGRVDLLLGKWRRGGDPLKPSRLLFLCDPEDETALPARAKRLFRESAPNENNPAWRFAWRLHPGPVVPATKISVTNFATFLDCPYRFHLKKRLGMESFDPLKKEGDAMDFGILVHDVLESFGKNKEARESSDAARIREFFRDALDQAFAKKYGSSPGLPLTQQKNSAWLRLAQAAEAQAVERRKGWVPIDAESWMSELLDGLEVRGRIDRIDRHEKDGSIRVLDYKTSGKTPAELHWGPVGPEPEIYPDYSRLTVLGAKGRELSKRWMGLQLPLYRWWAERQPEFAGADISVGYFILPAERDNIGVSLWPELDDEVMAAAMTCAQGVVADLQAGWTGSPRAKVKYDDYEEIFFHDPEEATVPLAAGEVTP
jgi:ATP-dependent helicase/nuclease subunit B